MPTQQMTRATKLATLIRGTSQTKIEDTARQLELAWMCSPIYKEEHASYIRAWEQLFTEMRLSEADKIEAVALAISRQRTESLDWLREYVRGMSVDLIVKLKALPPEDRLGWMLGTWTCGCAYCSEEGGDPDVER